MGKENGRRIANRRASGKFFGFLMFRTRASTDLRSRLSATDVPDLRTTPATSVSAPTFSAGAQWACSSLLAAFLILESIPCGFAAVAPPAPPATRVENFRESFHGQELVDPYHWLEESSSPATRQWIEAQNGYAQALLAPLPSRPALQRRLLEMLDHDSVDVPLLRNGYFYFGKRRAGQELWTFYRRKADGGHEELLLDPNPLSPDHTTSISVAGITDNGALVAYQVRQGGRDEAELHILDVAQHQDLPDPLPPALYRGFAFNKDGSGFYYGLQRRDTGQRLFYHSLRTKSADIEVFAKGADTWVAPVVSENGRYLLVVARHGWSSDELYIQNLQSDSAIRPLVTGLNAKFEPVFAGDFLFVQTDWKAPKGRVLRIDLRDPAPEKWRELVAEGDDALQASAIFGGKLFLTHLHNVASVIRIFSLDGKPQGEVPVPALSTAGISGRADQQEGLLFCSSYTTPYSIYRYNAVTGTKTLWYRDAVPFPSNDFETEQVWYRSKDGTRIPMCLIHRKGLKPQGDTPTILFGYGGFDVSLTPDFNHKCAWWIEHGGLYAVANLRGGGEFGQQWHQAGMLEKKQNVFDDFIAGSEWLIAHHYTRPAKLAIYGGSNGGLLVAAALTQRPDLYRAVICWHPDLDMVRYYKYTKNNNPPALLEYGNAADAGQFKFLYAYSPYEHVRPGTRYPAVLLESGDADTRVPPEQARKMTARLQAASTSGYPILLLYDAKAGHAGGLPFTKTVEQATDELSFVAWQLGLPAR